MPDHNIDFNIDIKNIFVKNTVQVSPELRKLIALEQDNKCNICKTYL